MKLSVIVPVYNTAGEGKLEYCLDSLIGQTLSDLEIVAVDDCSTDQSWEILTRYEKENPGRLRAVHSEVNRKMCIRDSAAAGWLKTAAGKVPHARREGKRTS